MEYTAKALVLKVGRFRESDLWVRLLAPGRGVFTAFAFGGCRSRRRFCGCFDPMNQVQVRVKSDPRGRYLHLSEGRLLACHRRLRSDQARLGMAVNCLKFAEAVQQGPEGSEETYRLLCELLAVMDRPEAVPPVLPLYFRTRMAFAHGFGPELTTCLVCGRGVNDMASPHFAVERGRVVCGSCRTGIGRCLPVFPGTLAALGHLAASAPRQWPNLVLPAAVRGQCGEIVEQFIEYHLGLGQDRGGSGRS